MKGFYLICRWIGRIFSLLIILATILFFVGEGVELSEVNRRDIILFIFFPAGLVVGFIIAWWKELAGGIAAIGSALLFYIVHFGFDGVWPNGVWFMIFSIPGILFLLAGIMKPRRGLPRIRFPDE